MALTKLKRSSLNKTFIHWDDSNCAVKDIKNRSYIDIKIDAFLNSNAFLFYKKTLNTRKGNYVKSLKIMTNTEMTSPLK